MRNFRGLVGQRSERTENASLSREEGSDNLRRKGGKPGKRMGRGKGRKLLRSVSWLGASERASG